MGTLGVGLFATPDADAMQLRNLVYGHLLSAGIVYAVVKALGVTSASRALAFALSLFSMIVTRSVHPPGGGLVVLYMDSGLLRSLGGWFLIWPGLCSGLYVYAMASLFRSLRSRMRRFAFP